MPAKRLFACLALAIGIGFPKLVSAAPQAEIGSPTLESQMLALINQDRRAAGAGPLRAGPGLERVALAHSLDMADHGYFSHFTPQGASPYDRMALAGIHYRSAGENIGMDDGTAALVMLQQIDVAMLHSPEHRANLLRTAFTRVGIGIAILGGRLYVTEDFKS
jgi:uncharacterized protein YkwD